jgi:hypothetical protein
VGADLERVAREHDVDRDEETGAVLQAMLSAVLHLTYGTR